METGNFEFVTVFATIAIIVIFAILWTAFGVYLNWILESIYNGKIQRFKAYAQSWIQETQLHKNGDPYFDLFLMGAIWPISCSIFVISIIYKIVMYPFKGYWIDPVDSTEEHSEKPKITPKPQGTKNYKEKK